MDSFPSPPPQTDRVSALIDAAYAIGALDGALRGSPVACFWHERASVVGLAQCLALAGVSLTPAEFFRASVGLVEPVFFADLDRSLVGAIVAECLPSLAAGSLTERHVVRLKGSRLLPDDEWTADRRPSGATRDGVTTAIGAGMSGADVGTALPMLAATVRTALAAAGAHQERDWHGWLLAAQLPRVLTTARITRSPLPCLTGLSRAMRYSTVGRDEVAALLFPRLADQARDGLVMLRNLEACARAWRSRLDGLTARSRAGKAAGVFLVWPACTRPQLAATLGTTLAGAGTVLDVLISRGIVTRQLFDGITYYVASESLGGFKLEARQGRRIDAPRSVIAEFDAAIAAFNLLGIDLGGEATDLKLGA